MAKRAKRGIEFYRAAILGVSDASGELTPGLRSVASGFKAADGFNIRDLKAGKWSRGMKAKVSRYFDELQTLTAQEKIIVKTRSPARLRNAQAIGGHDPKFKFKVAFVPGTKTSKIEWNADNTLTIKEKGYRKDDYIFNQAALARDPRAEIAKAFEREQFKRAKAFGILTGANVMLGGGIPTSEKGVLGKVIQLMQKYDGRKPLPRGSGNYGDKPNAHHYSKWLHGIKAYTFRDVGKREDKIDFEMQANLAKQRRRAAQRKAAYRAAVKQRGKK